MKAFFCKIVTLLTLLTAFAFSEVPADSFTYINAFTSASIYHSCTLFTSKVFKDRAELNWKEYWKFDNKVRAYKIKWGTVQDVYTDSLNLTEFLSNYDDSMTMKTIILNNLQQGTKYYTLIHRDYNGDLYNRPFVFTTPPLDPIQPVPPDDMGYIDPTAVIFSRPSAQFSRPADIKSVEITSINGQRFSRFSFTSFQNTANTISHSKLVPGLYIASFKSRENVTLSATRFMIN